MIDYRESIPVGVPNVDLDELMNTHGREIVEKSQSVWEIMLLKIRYTPVANNILASGSPQQGWTSFLRFYEDRGNAERARLIREWHDLQQGEDESALEYLTRAETLRMLLESYGAGYGEQESCSPLLASSLPASLRASEGTVP